MKNIKRIRMNHVKNIQKVSSETDSVIKYYIIDPRIQQQVTQQPANALIQLDTLQFCNQIGDQADVFTNSNLKILLYKQQKIVLVTGSKTVKLRT
jgi:hypothetical protein